MKELADAFTAYQQLQGTVLKTNVGLGAAGITTLVATGAAIGPIGWLGLGILAATGLVNVASEAKTNQTLAFTRRQQC